MKNFQKKSPLPLTNHIPVYRAWHGVTANLPPCPPCRAEVPPFGTKDGACRVVAPSEDGLPRRPGGWGQVPNQSETLRSIPSQTEAIRTNIFSALVSEPFGPVGTNSNHKPPCHFTYGHLFSLHLPP